jgi:hypothetical protein
VDFPALLPGMAIGIVECWSPRCWTTGSFFVGMILILCAEALGLYGTLLQLFISLACIEAVSPSLFPIA